MNDTFASSDPLPAQIDQFQRIMVRFTQCCQERSQRLSERFSLPDAEIRALLLFTDHRYLTAKSIAQQMRITRSRVTKITEGLERRGLLLRTKDPEDSRYTLLSLSADGQKTLKSLEDFNHAMNKAILATLDQAQRTTVISSLSLLQACMQAVRNTMT